MDQALKDSIYAELKQLLEVYKTDFRVYEDSKQYSLTTKKRMEVAGVVRPDGYYFAGLRMMKGFVGFYFMPLYIESPLRHRVPETIQKLLKGKTCFNIKKLTPEIKAGLDELMQSGIAAYKKHGWI